MKKKDTHKYREQTSGYQWGGKSRKGQDRSRGLSHKTTMYKINELQGYIVQAKEYSQYFIIIMNE